MAATNTPSVAITTITTKADRKPWKRELLTGPKRFSELEQGRPGIATNVLSSRMRDLEETGLVERSLVSPSSSSVAYGLTPYGLELEEPVVHLGLWGSKSLGMPQEDDFFSPSAFSLALRGAYRADMAKDDDFVLELRISGRPMVVSVRDGHLTFPAEPPSTPHVALEGDPQVFAELLAGTVDIDSAIATDRVRLEGGKRAARRFFEVFHLPSREKTST